MLETIKHTAVFYLSTPKITYLRLRDISRIAVAFFIAASILSLVVLIGAVENIVNVVITNYEHVYSSVVHSIAVIVMAGVLFYLSTDAIIYENEFQLALILFLSLGITSVGIVYKVFQIIKIASTDTIRDYETASIVHIVVMSLTMIFSLVIQIVFLVLVYPLYKKFGWRIFRCCGTNPELIKRFKAYCWWETVLRMDLVIHILVLLLSIAFYSFPFMYIIPCVLICLTLIAFFVEREFGVRGESYVIHFSFILFCFLSPIYFSFRVIYASSGNFNPLVGEESKIDMNFTRVVSVVGGTVAIVCRLALIISSIVITYIFNKGLVPVYQNQRRDDKTYVPT